MKNLLPQMGARIIFDRYIILYRDFNAQIYVFFGGNFNVGELATIRIGARRGGVLRVRGCFGEWEERLRQVDFVHLKMTVAVWIGWSLAVRMNRSRRRKVRWRHGCRRRGAGIG